VGSLYRRAHVLVAPYRAEGFALPIAEAMACGTVVIATAGGGAADYLDDEVGYVIRSTEFVARNTTEYVDT